MLKLTASLGFAALLCGCSTDTPISTFVTPSLVNLPGGVEPEVHSQTDIRLTHANFMVVKTNVVGVSRGFYLFGVITMVPPEFHTAMGRVYGSAQMQAGKPQTLANVVVEKTTGYWVLFSLPQYSVRADVIEFIPETKSKDLEPSAAPRPQ